MGFWLNRVWIALCLAVGTFHTSTARNSLESYLRRSFEPPSELCFDFFFLLCLFFFLLEWGPFCGLGENHFEAQKGGKGG